MALRRFLRRRPIFRRTRAQMVTKSNVDSFIYDLEEMTIDITYADNTFETIDHVASIEFNGDVITASCTPSSLEVQFRGTGVVHIK